jgi:WD40-like Beta Propeller Repeat
VHGGAVWTMAADGAMRRRIPGTEQAGQPAWSPRGDRIAFARSGPGDRSSIWMVDPVGRHPRPAFAPGGNYSSPAWSPDGTKLAVVSDRLLNDGLLTTVAVSDPVGSPPRTVARLRTKETLESIGAPVFTPDGRLAYTASTEDQQATLHFAIHVVDLDGTHDHVFLTDAAGGAWSPDGRSLAYADTRDHHGQDCNDDFCAPNAEVAVVAADGSARRVLTNTTTDEPDPAWSADGTHIAFSSTRNTPDVQYADPEVYTVATDGSCLTWLTNGSPGSSSPSWSPERSSSDPGGCGDRHRQPRVETKLGHSTLRPLWLGSTFRGALLSGTQENIVEYEDCGRFDPARCSPTFLLSELDTCHPQHLVDQNVNAFDLRALARGRWVGRMRLGQVEQGGGSILLAGHTLVSIQDDLPGASPQRHRELVLAIAGSLRRASGGPHARIGAPRMAAQYRRHLPARLRARIQACA